MYSKMLGTTSTFAVKAWTPAENFVSWDKSK